MIVITSAGEECEKKSPSILVEGKPDEYFFLRFSVLLLWSI